MFAQSIVAIAYMAGAAIAQSTSTSSSVATSIVTSSIAAEVSGTTKASWCNAQQNVCKLLCSSNFETNTCDPTTLTYSCTCNNGTSPGLQYYMNTIDYYTCEQAYADCITANPNNQLAQDGCTTNIRNNCGTLDVASYTAAATTSSSSTAASTASSTTGSASSTTASATAATSSSAAMAHKELGAGAFGAGLLAVFGLFL